MAAEELVIADKEIEPLRVGGAHKPDVIDARLVVIDEEAGALAVVDVDFPGVMDVVFGLKHVLDDQLIQGLIQDYVRPAEFLFGELLLQCLFHNGFMLTRHSQGMFCLAIIASSTGVTLHQNRRERQEIRE